MSGEGRSVEQVCGHPAVRTLLRTRGELSAMLLDERSGATQQLNDSAAVVWALLDRPITVDELVADLVEVTGLQPEPAAEIVAAALETFAEVDLLADPNAPDNGIGADDETSPPTAADVDVPQRLSRPPDP